jgi:hypothetical protein
MSIQLLNTGPPIFTKALEALSVTVGSKLSYVLPSVIDPDNDTVSIAVNLGSALSFTTFNQSEIVFEPKSLSSPSTTYEINIKLTDGNPSPKSSSYILLVTVFSTNTVDNQTNYMPIIVNASAPNTSASKKSVPSFASLRCLKVSNTG